MPPGEGEVDSRMNARVQAAFGFEHPGATNKSNSRFPSEMTTNREILYTASTLTATWL